MKALPHALIFLWFVFLTGACTTHETNPPSVGETSQNSPDSPTPVQESVPSDTDTPSSPLRDTTGLLSNEDFHYVGSFRLPHDTRGGSSFNNGGWAMTFKPTGDPLGPNDGTPGSLLIVGNWRQSSIAEVSIPRPMLLSWGLAALPVASYLHDFIDITEGMALELNTGGNEYRLEGLQWLPPQGAQHTPKIYWTARTFYNVALVNQTTHGMSNDDYADLNAKGRWRLGNFHSQMTAGPILEIPDEFANTYLGGKKLASGLFTAQGVSASSAGPALFAYGPWLDSNTGSPRSGTALTTQALLYYPYTYLETSNFPDYQIPDLWKGSAWIDLPEKEGVIFTGRRAMGPTQYRPQVPEDCMQEKGYHGDPYEPRIVFYDPNDFIKVIHGELQPWEVMPYLEWNPQAYLVNDCTWDLHAAAWDKESHLLYILQRHAENSVERGNFPVVHVFRIE